MSFITYLQNLGATHLFDLDNNGTSTNDDLGDSQTPTSLSLGNNSSFVTSPTCEGVTHSLESTNNTSPSISGATVTNVDDINADTSLSTQDYEKYAVILWVNQNNIWNATSIYEQGASVNNFAFIGGALTTWQAADSGKPFLIIQSKSLTQPNRPYFYAGVWERYNQHAGTGNRILFYVNGVLQGTAEEANTDLFPYHAGLITLGNCQISLKSFNETTLQSQTVAKNLNFWATFNDQTLTAQDFRDIFERTTFAEVTIAADTVLNQQAALDALTGNTYQDINCAIRILQATDQTNYRLFVDNIDFIADDNIQDISIQFVGTGILTLENTNGTVIKYTSSPDEVEKTTGVITGGGSIVTVNNTIRKKTNDTITNSTATKLVFDGSGNAYTVSGGTISTFENITGNTVTVTLTNNAPRPILIETNGSITLIQNVNITAPNILDGTRVQFFNTTKNSEISITVVSGGNGYTTTVDLLSSIIDDGDNIVLRCSFYDTTNGNVYDDLEIFGNITQSGLTSSLSQSLNTIISSIHSKGTAYHGNNVTGFSLDVANIEIDSNIVNIDGQKLATWFSHEIATTNDGIRNYFNSIQSIDERNFRFNKPIEIDNTGLPATWTSAAWVRTDGAPIVASTSNIIQFNNALSFVPSVGSKDSEIDDIGTNIEELRANQVTANEGIKKSSLIIPYSDDLPNP